MGKLLITNCLEWSQKLRACFDSSGFSESRHIDEGDIHITSYKKLNIDNTNYVDSEGDFVAVAGSLFYKGLFGEDALNELLRDARTMSVTELRAGMIGSFVIAVYTNGRIRVFVDETHTYCFYYYADGCRFLLTNTFYHVQKCVSRPLNMDALLERGVRGGIAGLESPYDGVLSLSARECFEIVPKSGEYSLQRCELNDHSVHFESKHEAIETIWTRTQAVASLRAKHFKSTLQFVTGGIDSRLELAINLYNQDNVSVGYWMGEDVITNGTNSDLEISQMIAETFGLKSKCYDVAESYSASLEGLDESRCDKYGEYASKYAGNRKWYSIFENTKTVDCFGFGYFGETLRELGELDRYYHPGFTVFDFIRDIYCRTGLEKGVIISPTFYHRLSKEFLELLSIDGEGSLSMDDCYRAFAYTRFSADCLLNNICNMFCYSFPILGCKPIADAIFSMPYQWREGDGVSIELTKRWEPKLLKMPYYSHHHKIVLRDDGSSVKETSINRIVGSLKPRLSKTKIYDLVYLGLLQRFFRPQSVNNKTIFNRCLDYLDRSPSIKASGLTISHPSTWKDVELATFATFVADVKVADTLLLNSGQ